ncbi:MAG: UbiA family prenyltransferase, partial [Candidatus Heimdallarchaeaceae archaeon]
MFSIAGIAAAGVFLNLITMSVVFIGFFFDVVIYSMWLKRRTKYSIIFGGIAGGLPAIAGRVAVTNSIDIISLLIG